MKTKRYILYAIILILLILLFRQCSITSSERKQADNTRDFLTDSITFTIGKHGQEIASKTALYSNLELLLTKQRDSNGYLKDLIKDYKKVIAAGSIGTVVKIDTIFIGYEVPIPFKFHREWEKKEQWYSLKGISDQNGNTITDLEVPNELSFAVGDKFKGFFSTTYSISAANSNPFVKTTQLDAFALKVPQKRLNISLSAGYGFTKDGFSPFVGLTAGYSLFQF